MGGSSNLDWIVMEGLIVESMFVLTLMKVNQSYKDLLQIHKSTGRKPADTSSLFTFPIIQNFAYKCLEMKFLGHMECIYIIFKILLYSKCFFFPLKLHSYPEVLIFTHLKFLSVEYEMLPCTKLNITDYSRV